MKLEQLVNAYPRLYHMATEGSWESIRKYGLLSTSAILDLFAMPSGTRDLLESQRRPRIVPLKDPRIGSFEIRDNSPIDDAGLRRALQDGLTPRDWYQTINGRVFFWVSEHRLEGMLGARAYRNKRHCVLTIDTSLLLAVHERDTWLSPMNTGATKPFPFPRGRNTFQRIRDFDFTARRRVAPLRNAVVELTVDYSVKNIAEYVIRVEGRQVGTRSTLEWEQ
ncbi:MAG: hypothetical protein M3Z54_10145 [Gemmatimonadota bacterium]|nr:hypothetical protein [Gemmatimonadota bacterium]